MWFVWIAAHLGCQAGALNALIAAGADTEAATRGGATPVFPSANAAAFGYEPSGADYGHFPLPNPVIFFVRFVECHQVARRRQHCRM